MLDIANFTFLGARYFCISYKYSLALFWDVVSLVGNDLIPPKLAVKLFM